MKKRLLKIMNIFIGASVILLNIKINANPTKSYQVRQKMESFLQKEKKNEKVGYKYLAEQLCIYFRPPLFPDEELNFNTPFGFARIDIKPTRSIFVTNGINAYKKIAETLDEILTINGRKRLAKIILEYLETDTDEKYKEKTFNKYKFTKYEDFFDLKNEKSKFYFKIESNNESDSNDTEQLSKKMKDLTISKNTDTQLNKINDKKNVNVHKKSQKGLSPSEKETKKKLEKAKDAANILCAILMVAEPNYRRSFDGGKHERALIRDIRYSGITFTEAFEKFVPSTKGGGQLAYDYSTDETGTNEILESEYYSDNENENKHKDDDSTYGLELLSIWFRYYI